MPRVHVQKVTITAVKRKTSEVLLKPEHKLMCYMLN